MDLSVYIENFHFSGCFFSLVVRIFTSTLVYVVDLMVRYIYGKPGRWEWLFPKMDKKSKSRQTQSRSRMHVINGS